MENFTNQEKIADIDKEKPAEDLKSFDLKDTLEWYEKNADFIYGKINLKSEENNSEPFAFPIENEQYLNLNQSELKSIFNLFPQNARERSSFKTIIGEPQTWFKKGMGADNPEITQDPKEALSPTAFVPGYTDSEYNIHIYDFDYHSEKAKKIAQIQSLVHEIGHTIVDPAMFEENYRLKLSDGTIKNGFDFKIEFAQIAEKYPPISEYAAGCRGRDGKFKRDPKYKGGVAADEELVETISAYVLGFIYSDDDQRGLTPFEDRPEIREFIERFLEAERI